MTTSDKWAKPSSRSFLLDLIEARLRISLMRAQTTSCDNTLQIDNVVAVVGVVGQYHCQKSVAMNVKVVSCPLLNRLMQVARFVFVKQHLQEEAFDASLAAAVSL